MALRRPRVKACANLSSKRKVRKESDDSNANANIKNIVNEENNQKLIETKESLHKAELENKLDCLTISNTQISLNNDDEPCVIEEKKNITIDSNQVYSEIKDDLNKPVKTTDKTITEDFKRPPSQPFTSEPLNISDTSIITDLKSPPHNLELSTTPESSIVLNFKCPPILEKKEKLTSTQSTVTDNVLSHHYDSSQQQSASNSSPVKHRQRIRPMPFFGMRRNSIQGSNTDSEDESKRHHKSSTSTVVHSPMILEHNRMNAFNYNRKRTESTCSNISESGRGSDRPRKVYITEESQRIATAKKEFNTKFDGGVPDKSVLKMFDFIYYNPVTNPMKQMQKSVVEEDNSTTVESQPNVDNPKSEINENTQETTEKNNEAPNIPVPQLKLGANGELVLDETSLVIETTAEKEAREKLANSNVIYVDENTENNGFYKRQKRTRDWSAEETIKFYRCLHTVGTDFSLMLTLFPNRSRRDLKLKFKKEEKHNLALINKALLYPKTFDIEELKLELEKDEKEAAEKQKKWEEIKRKNQMQKDAIKAKSVKKGKSACALNHGDIVYENENVVDTKSKRKKQSLVSKTTDSNVNTHNFEVTIPKNGNDELDNEEDHTISEQKLVDALFDTEDCEDNNTADTNTSDSCNQIGIIKSSTEDIDNIKNSKTNNKELFELQLNKSEDTELRTDNLEDKFFSNINNVLREIANGSLVAVSSEDPENPEKITHEIYVVCKETGELSEEPLDLPEEIMECIISAISM